MKKITSILLSFILVISSIGTVFADENGSMSNFKEIKKYTDGQFADVSSEDWFAESVKNAYELGLISGTSETTFNPNANITLAETITLASRLNNAYYGNTHTFDSSEVWYQTYVDYAIEKGIIKSAEYTDLNAFATRSQFAQIFAFALPNEALKEINEVDDYFIPDVSMDSDYAKSVYKLYRAGILTGNDDKGTFTPDTNIQRSAVAAIVSRMATKDMRMNVTFKLPTLYVIGNFTPMGLIFAHLVKYENKVYNIPTYLINYYNGELYSYTTLGNALDFLFQQISSTPNDNPFVDGTMSISSEKEYKIIDNLQYVSATKQVNFYSIEYKNKIFQCFSSQDFITSNLEIGSFGIWNGVKFYIDDNEIRYNLNDLAKYFEIKRSFSYETSEKDGNILIITE